MSALPLPMTVDEITPAWLSRALGAHGADVDVASVEVDSVIAGSATKIRLRIEYGAEGDGSRPSVMIAKTCFDEAMRDLVARGNATEARFFREVAPVLEGVERPACHFAATDPSSGQSIVLLEDLTERGATFGRATEPLDAEAAASVLEQQARIHATWWDAGAAPVGFEVGASGLRLVMEHILGPESWEHALGLPRAATVPEQLRDRARVRDAVVALWAADEAPPHCFIHGDAHLGNLYFDASGAPGHLDWQTAQRGRWAHDVTYFLVGALEIEDRRRSERDLLAHYVDRLAGFGAPAPSLEEAWLEYRRHLFHGFTWIVCPVEMQPEDVCTANTARFAAAIEDLDAFATLELS